MSAFVLVTAALYLENAQAQPLTLDTRLEQRSVAPRCQGEHCHDSLIPSSQHTHESRPFRHLHEIRSPLNVGARTHVQHAQAVEGAGPEPEAQPAPPKMHKPKGGRPMPHPGGGEPIVAKVDTPDGPGTRSHTGVTQKDTKAGLAWLDMSTVTIHPSQDDPMVDNVYEPSESEALLRTRDGTDHQNLGTWWSDDGKKQKPLTQLTSNEQEGLQAEAMRRGRHTERVMNSYVSERKSSLYSYPKGKQSTNIPIHYDIVPAKQEAHLGTYKGADMEKPFVSSGFDTINNDTPLRSVKVTSKAKPSPSTDIDLIDIVATKSLGLFITRSLFSDADGTDESDRQYSSSLLWAAWKAVAGDAAHTLRGQEHFKIIDQQTNNYLAIAHQDYTEQVIEIPQGNDGRPLSPIAGHGIWRPGHPMFTLLHASPVVEMNAYMLMEQNPGMDNPYLLEIHTFPRVVMGLGPTNIVPGSAARETVIVFVYGPKPS